MTDRPAGSMPATLILMHNGQWLLTQYSSPQNRNEGPQLLTELRLHNLGPSSAVLLNITVQWPGDLSNEFTLPLEQVVAPGEETPLISPSRRQALLDAMAPKQADDFSTLGQDMVLTADISAGQMTHQFVLRGGWLDVHRFALQSARQQPAGNAALLDPG